MRNLLITLVLLLLHFTSYSQINIEKIRYGSWNTIAYPVTAAEAERFIQWDSISLQDLQERRPKMSFHTDSVDTDLLPVGNYVLVSAKGIYLQTKFVCVSKLKLHTVNNKHQLQIDVGPEAEAARVFVNNKEARYNKESGTFWVNGRKLEKALVKVYAPADTLFVTLEASDNYYSPPLSEQNKNHFRTTKLYYCLNWIPSKIKKLFGHKYRRQHPAQAKGYIIFNQPKYKLLDTVKFKGYIVDKKGRQLKKETAVHLVYSHNGISKDQLITRLNPISDGAYTGEFVLADTLPVDMKYQLIFRDHQRRQLIQNSFKTEDYLLDEIASYQFTTAKKTYYRNDSLVFTATAKDANGLNILDGRATLLLTTSAITNFYQDSLFVPDTIYRKEIILKTDADTKISVAGAALPKADMRITAKMLFRNSNNEMHEESEIITYKYLSKEIVVTQKEDSLFAVYVEDGIEKSATGEYTFNDEKADPLQYPAAVKINPLAEEYSFYIHSQQNKTAFAKHVEIKDDYRLNFSRISRNDTAGFILHNPYRVPVYFTLFNGGRIIASGKKDDVWVRWEQSIKNKKQSYKVRWQYFWAGREHYGAETIGLLYNLLDIKLNTSNSVYPGQRDSLYIDIKDYRGMPAAKVNLTAVSYNNQFSSEIRVQDPPYLAHYKNNRLVEYPGYENEDPAVSFTKNYLLGQHKRWIPLMGLDSMPYYKLLFPKDGFHDEINPIPGPTPQLSVNIVQKGVPQEIYLLYINRQLVYYNGVTDKINSAYEVFPHNVQLGIRLKDQYIEIDSLYIQPYYKHELSFDLDQLPRYSKLTPAEKHWSYEEMNLLERSILQMQPDLQNNNAWLWQGNRVLRLSGYRDHITGPFKNDSIQFFSPEKFDIKFNFEPGYQYKMSKQVLRLEKKPLFPQRNKPNFLPQKGTAHIRYGDTLLAAPVLLYQLKKDKIALKLTPYDHKNSYSINDPGLGALQWTVHGDSSFSYFILEPVQPPQKRIILGGNNGSNTMKNIAPGNYTMLLLTNNDYIAQVNRIEIKSNYTTCLKADAVSFSKNNLLLNEILRDCREKEEAPSETQKISREIINPLSDSFLYTNTAGAKVSGKITDSRGNFGIPGAIVSIKGYRTGVQCDSKGNFHIGRIKSGRYVLQFSAVGYETKELELYAAVDSYSKLDVSLQISTQQLEEVVVVGYGISRKKDLTASMSVINAMQLSISNQLSGRVPGVQIVSGSGIPGAGTSVLLRGISTIESASKPLYVVDGILHDEKPGNIKPDNIQYISILEDAAATALYGARAAYGVILITTKTNGLRKSFKDYALWHPNFFTDENGKATIGINYPDNITGWKTFVVGMDKKNRMGKSFTLTQSYKPITAELSIPQFLIEGDTIAIIGKSKNYTLHKYDISTQFSVGSKLLPMMDKILLPNSSLIDTTVLTSECSDTIKTSFNLASRTGFTDGEQRQIPVLKKGTEEVKGNFWIFKGDTTLSFKPDTLLPKLTLYAQNNTLDVLLDELNHLRSYPYYCMEQIASKLTGLAAEKTIREHLHQPFKNQKEFNKLLDKIQTSQSFDGGWAWWEGGKSNFFISNHICNTLLQFRSEPLVETNIRNAFLYLEQQLPVLNTAQRLAALYTLSNGGHETNYLQWLDKLSFDSLPQHQQWQYISISKSQKFDFSTELKKMMSKKTASMLGGIHWGTDKSTWYDNDIATTLLAYKVIEQDSTHSRWCDAIIQYFFEKRKSGYWTNTVASATILKTILPTILAQHKNFAKPAVLEIGGDTSFTINQFPFKKELNAGNIKNIHINKYGGGMLYFTAYQHGFNSDPQPVEDRFIVTTHFHKNGQRLSRIKAGEKITMTVKVQALLDAEFIQLEIPIPAGCTYASKTNSNWRMHSEYFKHKVELFSEFLEKGSHQFDIELESRYNGSFTINPSKVSMMYFPVYFGRNGLGKIAISN